MDNMALDLFLIPKSSDDESKDKNWEGTLDWWALWLHSDSRKKQRKKKKEKCYHTLFIWVGIDYHRGFLKSISNPELSGKNNKIK